MKNPVSHIVCGSIIASVLVLINVIFIVLDVTGNTKVSWIASVINIGLLIYFIRENGNAHDNNKSFGELFSYGFKASALTTIILTAFMIVYTYAFPESESKVVEIARQQMETDPRINEDQIEGALETVRKFYFPILIAGTIFGTMIVGALGSLIGAAVTKKNNTTPFHSA